MLYYVTIGGDTIFINLHCHTAKGSLLDSMLTPEQMVDFAVDNDMTAIALTDHGKMSAYVDFVKACNKKKVKPIVGLEAYEVDDMFEKADTKEYTQPRYHIVFLAKTQTGFQNLIQIASVSNTIGKYKKPLISLDYIEEHNLGNGIIALTACQAGRVSRYLEDDDTEQTLTFVNRIKGIFDDVYLEIQSHSTEEQTICNQKIVQFAEENSFPYVVTTDAHMMSGKDQQSHAMFVEISEDREVGESYTDCFLQSESQVYETLKGTLPNSVIKKAIETTMQIANDIDDIDIGLNKGNIMPVINVPLSYDTHEDYLEYLVYNTFDEKFSHLSSEEQIKRRDRIKIELPILFKLDYTDYFIMLYMLAKEARNRNIPLGYSRGSGANCLCLFMLNVTQIDSVLWDLDFSRFANLGRKSIADFDWDISKRRRKEFIEISEELFGKENVAPICTFNTLSTKVAIRDIGKVLDEKEDSPYYKQIPYSLRDEVSKMIPTIKTLNDLGEEEEKELLLKDVVSKNKKLEAVYIKFPRWFKYVMDVEGLPKSLGRHAAGTLITPHPITNYCPVCYDAEGDIMVQIEMHNAMDDLGLTKMDYLGLETLDIIDDTLKLSGITWKDVDINHLDLLDSKVYNGIYKKGHTIGIFQMESAEGKRMCIEADTDNIEDVIAINAANRPGTKDGFPTYCFHKANPDKVSVLHDDLREIFGKTHYILLYQEQALNLFRYAGFPEEEVDNARRAIGKKLPEEMKKLRKQFEHGLVQKGWNNGQIDEIWELMEKQSSYSFNRGHAVSYGLLSYLTAYLKTHYPLEFMTSCLSSKSDKVERLSVFINECNRLGIKVSPPHVNKSGELFTALKDSNEILFGLLAIKGLGESVVKEIIANRPYSGIDDFCTKIQSQSTTVTLIKAGALPTKDKMTLLKKYAESLFVWKSYEPVKSYKTKQEMLLKWDIDVDSYKIGSKIDKDRVLAIYNQKKKEQYESQQREKYKKHMQDFRNKYASQPYMWEFDTLSMFLTDDPLKKAYEHIRDWDLIDNGNECTVLCVIVDIKRKKDKNGNQFAYLDLYTPFGIIESTVWSRQFKDYLDLIKKGTPLAIRGRKSEDKLFVAEMKPFEKWKSDKKKVG